MKIQDLPARCFQGVTPSMIATCDAEGTPNITYLSQVFLVDDRHVALSCQFFNKTKKNVLENPLATLQVYDPLTFDSFQIAVRYVRAETEGKLFEGMSRRIDAIASHVGMAGVFKLRSADVYEILSVEPTPGFRTPTDLLAQPDAAAIDPIQYRSEMTGLQHVSQRVCRARDLEELFTRTLEALDEALGFETSMILLPDETGSRLYAIASRGYGESGVGAEVGLGEGLIGTVARERCILRVAGVGAELRYGRAIRTSVQRAAGTRGLRPEIPLPGLVDAQSQMALPLVAGDRLVGVIAVESQKSAAFEAWHEAFLDIIGNQIATAIDVMSLRAQDAQDERDERDARAKEEEEEGDPVSDVVPPGAEDGRTLKLKFFKSDDCVFADDEYLVRNVPGRILWKILREHSARGRTEFSNRELRLDGSLGLPAIRDNLESRLVLLRKRLEQKCPAIKLVSIGRGRFRVDLACRVDLEECA